MTISQAIATAEELKPHGYSYSVLVQWLSEIDGLVKKEILDTHPGASGAAEDFDGYDEDTPGDTALLVPDPYSRLYFFYLSTMIDLNNGETDKYANSSELFNASYEEYAAFCNRTVKPVSGGNVKGLGVRL